MTFSDPVARAARDQRFGSLVIFREHLYRGVIDVTHGVVSLDRDRQPATIDVIKELTIYSLKGTSGGTIFFEPNNRDLTDASSEQLFRFAGIGLEHRKKQDIKGASGKLVTGLLCDYIDNNLTSMTTMDVVITCK